MGLTRKQRTFINSYLKSWNATQAAIEAGYSEKTAANIGYENVKKPEIAAAISRRLQESAMSADEALMRLAEQARNDHGRYIQPDGTVDMYGLIADGMTHLIKGTKDTAHGLVVEFYDAQSALTTILKAHGKLDGKGSKEDPVYMVQVNADDLAEARKQADEIEMELLAHSNGNGNGDGN